MPGQHRKRTTDRKLTALAVCGIAAAAVVVLWAVIRPGSHARHVTANDSPASSAVETTPAPTAVPPPVQPAQAAAAAEPPPLSEKQAAQHPPPPPPPVPCSTELAGTRPHVAQVGNLLKQTFGVSDIGGAVGRGDGDHGAGLALDLMTSDFARGDAIADFVLANKQRFGVTYVIWRQRYNDGSGWSYLEDRGSLTANHYDHVHVSFDRAAEVYVTC
ncbi:hypothetical protein ACRS5S_02285 [Nocardia asiatica]|uniref:hypothetical protein n=1 Tax=Nocardia asiatica TaxID=209252 RepID=UPI0002DA5801|nr:hypothetical protein [Nocardia asiatica]